MKKIISALLALCCIIMPLSGVAADSGNVTIVLKINDPYMTVNGELKELDPGRGTAPVIADGRTMVPLRAVVEEIGGEIKWDGESREVTISKDGTEIKLTIDSTASFVNENEITLDSSPVIIDGRTFLPARFVMETMGYSVIWNSAEQSVIIANNYDDITVAEVDGESISLADFNFAYYSSAAQYKQYYANMGISDWENQLIDGKKCSDLVRNSAMEETIRFVVTENKAKEYGITAKEIMDKVQQQKNEIISGNFGGEAAYGKYLDNYFTSDAAIESYLIRGNILSALFEKMSSAGGECDIGDEELPYNDDTYFKVKHVLVSTMNGLSKEDALAAANEVIEKLNAGEDMDTLIEAYGDDPGMKTEDYYIFTEGEMVDEFYQASKNLNIGEWSQTPVESAYGYHVIQRYALDKETNGKFQQLKENAKKSKFLSLFEAWLAEANITIYDDIIDGALQAQR